MIRKQVYIEPRQDVLLKERSTALGITEAELIRRCIETLPRTPKFIPDDSAWRTKARDELIAFMEERSKIKVPQTGRQWTREDIYEERLGRFSR